jgi:hypothetical protein
MPLPQADTIILRGAPGNVAAEAASWLTAQGVPLERWNARDAYVETVWYDTTTKQGRRGEGALDRLPTSVKIRCWADPAAPGRTRLTVEAVYRPFYDPSDRPRDRELAVPVNSGGRALVERLLRDLNTRLGITPPSSSPTSP